MRITLCYPPVSEIYNKIRDSGLAPHLSTLCIASHLKRIFPDLVFQILDGHHMTLDNLKEAIRSFEPEIIGYSVDFTNYDNAVACCRYVRENLPESWNVMGSNHATNLAEVILKNQESVDFISLYDGEPSWEDLVRIRRGELDRRYGRNLAYVQHQPQIPGQSRKNTGNEQTGAYADHAASEVVFTPQYRMELEDMADVDYTLIDLEPYFEAQKKVLGENFRMLQFTSQRGCANKPLCVFCGRYTDGIRFRDPAAYAREVAYWTDKFELTEVWDRSDSFIQNVLWLKRFCEALEQYTDRFRTGKTTFKTYARADQLLRDDVIRMLKQLNFRMVFIGYEAGDDRILQNIGKHATLDVYRRASRKVLEHELDIDASFIVGLPGENRESLRHHLEFVKELIGMGLDKIRVNRLLVLPGTPLYAAVMERFPQLAERDSIHQDLLQRCLFQTKLYDLSEFDQDVDAFMEQLRRTASAMTGAVLEQGGGAEGYGYGKGCNILAGKQLQSKAAEEKSIRQTEAG